jgi:hypothetical protein
MAAEECLPTKIKKYKKWYLRFDENIGGKSIQCMQKRRL